MPEKEDSALSQEAIDALLNGGVAATEDEDDQELDESVADPDDDDVFAPGDDDEEAGEPDSEPDISEVRSRGGAGDVLPASGNLPRMTGDVSEAAMRAITKDVAALTERVDGMEKALQQIASLEKQVRSLTKALDNQKELEALRTKISVLESGARNTPVFDLYEKMTCSSCGTHGAAQVKARCGGCGKEGWFGRKAPVEASQRTVEQPAPKLRLVPKAAPKGRQVDQPRSMKRAA